jgi:AcrR family transcriptional regulator
MDMTGGVRRARSTRQDWLDEGLAVLRTEGDQGLTVEALCARMGRTKGSFYHHFAGRDDFVVRLLEHWEQTFTGRIIEELEPVRDPVERLRALGERTASEVDLRLERTIRVWSDREPAAAVVVERVDREREGYLCRQLEAAIGDPRRARLAARAHMALLVGTEMLYQDLSRAELRELNAFVDHLGFDPENEGGGNRAAKGAP